jgi:ABC-type Mn2+/Zn2+ transport system permease subunit
MSSKWLEKALDILQEAVRKEKSSLAGLINLTGVIITAGGAYGSGLLKSFDSVISTAKGEDPQALSLLFSLLIAIVVMGGFLMCVKIISEAEKED